MDLRRSFGHGGDHVTAPAGFFNPTSGSALSAVQTSTQKKTKTFTSMNKPSKKMSSGGKTDSLKRKISKIGEKSNKRWKTTDDDNLDDFLGRLQAEIEVTLKTFARYKADDWYQDLETRRHLLPSLSSGNIPMTLKSLVQRAELKPFKELPPNRLVDELLKGKMNDLEILRKEITVISVELPAPSTYCLGTSYRRVKMDPMMTTVRDGRHEPSFPVALELLHNSFRTFTYFSFVDPIPLPGSPTYSEEKRLKQEDKETFIGVYQVANELLHSMPQLYDSHDDRLQAFFKNLQLIFPPDDTYEWSINATTPDRYRADAVYRNKHTRVPLIYVEVKTELGEGGNPFWQNHRVYQSYTENQENDCSNGAPVFLVQLCGAHLGIGGGFCDALGDNVPPVTLLLGGYVNLQHDYVGRNLSEAVNTLWALKKGVDAIIIEYHNFKSSHKLESRHKLKDVPRCGPEVEITDVINPGVVYLGRASKDSGLDLAGAIMEADPNFDLEKKLVVKVIYSGLACEHYGKTVHRLLHSKGMAPNYFVSFSVGGNGIPKDAKAIETYHMMEYLPEPSQDSPGWISLLDLKERFRQVALRHKEGIGKALYKILDVLRDHGFVHGDFRPNNLLINVTTPPPNDCIIHFRPSEPALPYLKVIDFDWAGQAGKVEYPPHRNPEVVWPGESGMAISKDDDRIMVDSWLKKWVEDDKDEDYHIPDRRGDVGTYLRISQPSS